MNKKVTGVDNKKEKKERNNNSWEMIQTGNDYSICTLKKMTANNFEFTVGYTLQW